MGAGQRYLFVFLSIYCPTAGPFFITKCTNIFRLYNRRNKTPSFTENKRMVLLEEAWAQVTADDWRKVVERTKKMCLQDCRSTVTRVCRLSRQRDDEG